jgi:4-hydroxy-2-oxoheptanedioate aldolase
MKNGSSSEPRNPMLEKLRDGRILLGVCNSYPAAGIIEVMGRGWDFMWIDGQHGQHSYESALNAVRASELVGCDTLLRVPGHEAGELSRHADMAPSMLMVPMIDTAAEAEAVVRATRFPPLGNRSYGGRRPIDMEGREYHARCEVALAAQIETPEAVRNAAAIAAVPGVDVLFFSPDDMKLRLGLPINTAADGPELREVMEKTARAARDAGKFCACASGSAAGAARAVEMGYQMLATGSDVGFIRTLAPAKLAEMRQATGGSDAPARPAAASSGSVIYGG